MAKMTVTEALLQAITMLDTVAKGGQYDAKEYHNLLHEIRRVHADAVVDEADHGDETLDDHEDTFECRVREHSMTNRPDRWERLVVENECGELIVLVAPQPKNLAGKSIRLNHQNGSEDATIVEVL